MQVTNDVALLDFEYNQSIIAKRHHLGKTDIKIVELFKIDNVTSITKSKENGELCKLSYKINLYTWDMYFCNKDFCPTANVPQIIAEFIDNFRIYKYIIILSRFRHSYFDFQRIGAVASLFGIDEISIQQGFCSNVSVTVTTVNGVSKSTIPIRTTESETSMTITMESPIITTDKSTIISDETITSISAKSEDILHNTTTMEIITDAAKKTTTSKSMPTGISTSIITENIELPSVANLSHVTTTAID
ncbi:unnamed protein product [Rotaria socialis]